MTDLYELDLSIINCQIKDERFYKIWHKKLNNLSQSLGKIRLVLPSKDYPSLRLANLI